MADHGITSPLLSPPPSDHPHLILTVQDETDTDSHHNGTHTHQSTSAHHHHSRNPFAFLGSDGFTVPVSTTADPFRNHTLEITGVYEWLKIGICLPVALARLVLFGVSLVIGFLATKLALLGWKDKKNPMPRWRCRIMWITRVCTRCILFAFGYHWIRRKGKPAPRDIAPIVVSNHVSFIEPIFYFYELFPTIVASESHDSIPFVGTIIRAMQVIYVNRFSASSRKQAVSEIKRKASCGRFPRVLLFPEGTTTNGRYLISFELGAFIPGFAIQPVVVRYPHVHFDQSWGHISLARLMFRMFTQFHNFMEVEYLPVVSPLENKKESAICFSERICAFMDVEKSGVITFKQFLFGSAHVVKQPLFRRACEFAFSECVSGESDHVSEQKFGESIRPAIPDLNEDEVRELFNLFDSDNDGRISKEDFLTCLRKNPLLIALFSPCLHNKDISEDGNRLVEEIV
ncbi:lysophospholipid acyltransferase LPEAT2-like [Pyrus ussuriensis x Pyrus communis]|uniref:Lysophospholipid acyltransferase LPEAT2-like n=1 Tax=Pyrus ussuriensis x Pyrus communis TaxID=2448454 RepID=A0A5N5HIN3_9ROSA|nr:lysophospholipid acyltransferase LPEAT2-like [Pyrus ussuriensis x Pyrus communis]